MKLRLLLGIVFFGLVSCSGDDTSENVNTNEPITEIPADSIPNTDSVPPANAEKHLKSIYIVIPNNTIGNIFIEFVNDRPVKYYSYSESGNKILYRNNIYENNVLTSVEIYANGTLYSTDRLIYDSQSRLVKVERGSHDGPSYMKDIFTYNSDNTITNNPEHGVSYYKTFNINDNDQIYAMQGNELLYGYDKIDYDGNNPVTYFSGGAIDNIYFTTHFTYNNEIEVKGHFLDYHLKEHGSNINCVLYNMNFDYILESGDKYIAVENPLNSTNSIITYQYEFDTDGYPVKRTKIGNGGIVYQYEVIEYQ